MCLRTLLLLCPCPVCLPLHTFPHTVHTFAAWLILRFCSRAIALASSAWCCDTSCFTSTAALALAAVSAASCSAFMPLICRQANPGNGGVQRGHKRVQTEGTEVVRGHTGGQLVPLEGADKGGRGDRGDRGGQRGQWGLESAARGA